MRQDHSEMLPDFLSWLAYGADFKRESAPLRVDSSDDSTWVSYGPVSANGIDSDYDKQECWFAHFKEGKHGITQYWLTIYD